MVEVVQSTESTPVETKKFHALAGTYDASIPRASGEIRKVAHVCALLPSKYVCHFAP